MGLYSPRDRLELVDGGQIRPNDNSVRRVTCRRVWTRSRVRLK